MSKTFMFPNLICNANIKFGYPNEAIWNAKSEIENIEVLGMSFLSTLHWKLKRVLGTLRVSLQLFSLIILTGKGLENFI